MPLISQGEISFDLLVNVSVSFLPNSKGPPCNHWEKKKKKKTSDHWLVSVPGVWISWWDQVFETGRLRAGHCGRRPFIHSLWHPNLCGPRNHCWNRVRLLGVGVSALTLGKGIFCCCCCCVFTCLLGMWRAGETVTCTMILIPGPWVCASSSKSPRPGLLSQGQSWSPQDGGEVGRRADTFCPKGNSFLYMKWAVWYRKAFFP